MDCPLIEAELPGYHLGTLDEATRRRVEEHLPDCGGCVRAYVILKRAFEVGGDLRPSDLARERLRRDVAREVAPLGRLSRRVRPAVGVAAALVLLVAGGVWLARARGTAQTPSLAAPTPGLSPPPITLPPGTAARQVDSARVEPVTLTVL